MTPQLWAAYRAPMAAEEMKSHLGAPLLPGIVSMLCEQVGALGPTLCVGCGDGTELAHFPHSIGVGLGGLPSAGRVVMADMHCLPFRDRSFDGVFCKDTFEHALAPTIVLSELCRVARRWVWLGIPEAGWAMSPHHPLIVTTQQLAVMASKLGWQTKHCRMQLSQLTGHSWMLDTYLLEPLNA